jgi:antitoxin component YwqK of YwqJK toxin-antitoxin module
MKKLLAAIFVALLMVGCGEDAQNKAVQNEAKIDLDDNETRNRIIAEAIESRYVDDVSTEDGKRLYRVPDKFKLVEDLRAGKISREELSVLQSKTELFTGWCKSFYPNGQIAHLFQAKNGKILDAWSWYQSGEKQIEVKNKDGELWTAFAWKPNGEKCPVTNVVNGNGVVVEYKEDGTEKRRQSYKDGISVRK